MTIADAPLWAQTPTGKIVRDLTFDKANSGSTEPFWVDLVWLAAGDTDDTGEWAPVVGVEAPGGMSVPEARSLWEALGDILAIESVTPALTHVAAEEWFTDDVDGARSRTKHTPRFAADARTGDGCAVSLGIELWDNIDRLGQDDIRNSVEIALSDDVGSALSLASAEDARALAFALMRAARVADIATSGTP